MVLHPLDPTVRYARTDVGNGYRWNNSTQQWIPMRVLNSDGSGIQSSSATANPSGYGIESFAVDPTNKSTVWIVFPTTTSCDVQCPTNNLEIYKSTDGGLHFTPGNMSTAAIAGNPNNNHRWTGERLAVDPANPSVLYFASESQGVFHSTDGGQTWSQFTGSSAPPTNIEFVNIQFAHAPGTVNINGVTASKTLYAVSINNSDSGGDVYQSNDGGQTWTDISTGVTDTASGQSLTHQALSSSIDPNDALYIAENSSTDGYQRAYWRYASGNWTRFSLQNGAINQPVVSVAVDPTNTQRIYALGADTSLARSDNAGQSWINLGAALYSNTLGWLPQTIGMANGEWHSNGGLRIDSSGNLWTPTGQEGPLTIAAAIASSATAANPPQWTISTSGIEELVAMDVTIPSGSGDTILAIAMDTTGFVISNPDNFSATQIPLQQEIISQGSTVAYAPDAPTYIAVSTGNVATGGRNYSGYSTNGGQTWTRFASLPQYTCDTTLCPIPPGMIAVSPRAGRTLGNDHIVLYPASQFAPQYSHDGGATWHVTQSFPLNSDGLTINSTNYTSYLYPQINQHMLRADPFVADKFYLKFTHAPAMLYISTDGGVTWQPQPNAALPDQAWQGQLEVNRFVKNDLWYADGWEGSTTHGLFHSTDGGQTFQQISGIAHAITIAIGAPSGNSTDATYTIYFYGQLSTDPQWGIFRSTSAGTNWDRIAYYPTSTYDRPTAMAASQDTFGKLVLGLSGESFVYGQLTGTTTPPPTPTISLAAAQGASTSQTIQQGGTATYQLNLSSTNVSGTVSFVCSGAPSGYTCAVPNPVTLTSTVTSTAVAVTVKPTSSSAAPMRATRAPRTPLAVALLILPLAFIRRLRTRAALLALTLFAVTGFNGCGSASSSGGNGGGGTTSTSTTYTLTITASATGLTSATQSLTLTIQ
jgi:BNR/Asp-box repeat